MNQAVCLELDEEEKSLLKHVLELYISELRGEISETDDYEMRQALKHEEAKLKGVLARF